MTHVINSFINSFVSDNECKYFSIEVITYDGQSVMLEVEADNADEAQELAAAQVENADYTMVQGGYSL